MDYIGTHEQLIYDLRAMPVRGGIVGKLVAREAATRLTNANAEIARLTSEVTQLRADLANARAVMVETCAREADAHYAAGDMGNPGHHIRALSTLSPIAAAARVLLADDVAISRMAEAVHDGPLMANDHQFTITTKQGQWCVEVVRAGLRAIAEQEKADG